MKNRFGVGYNLTISKLSRDPIPNCDKFILENIKNAKKIQEVSSEISYQLPTESSSQFKDFFYEFDKMMSYLGVKARNLKNLSTKVIRIWLKKHTYPPDQWKNWEKIWSLWNSKMGIRAIKAIKKSF